MNNRKKIERFCKENNIEILKLEFFRNREYAYNDSWDASFWDLSCKMNGIERAYSTHNGYTVNEGIDSMFKQMCNDIDRTNYALSLLKHNVCPTIEDALVESDRFFNKVAVGLTEPMKAPHRPDIEFVEEYDENGKLVRFVYYI